MIGSTIGSYRITGQLGEGGMGAVYRATDNIEREVAIKALHSHLTRDENRLQRFRAEAVALGRLHHPNIASLYHLLEQNGDYYMVMEFVDGQTLEDIVRAKGAMSPQMALAVFIEGLKGFEHAHARGVIHRDIKPSNLMVSTEGITKITDFGIARMAGAGRMTQTGKVIGTLEYMSPEQVRGLEQDARSDIYSLGILLFELLTGRMPFSATSDYDIMRAHLEEVPPPASTFVASLPAGLDGVISKALAKDPSARFGSVEEMRHALEAVARELPAAPSPTTLVALPTRQVELPSLIPATSEGQVLSPQNSVPVAATNQAPVINQGRPHQAPVVRPASAPKWMIPTGAAVAAVVLLGGLWSWSAGRSRSGAEVAPTPIATQQMASIGNEANTNEATNGTSHDAAGDVLPQVLPQVQPTSAPKHLPDADIPKIPGFNAPEVKATAVPPTPVPAATRPRVVEPRVPSVVPHPPSVRARERVADRPQTKPRPRLVSRPRPKPRVRQVEARRPPRVVPRPQRHHSSGGGGGSEESALRSLIKGG